MTSGDGHNEQLISAYLDGELTSEERQHVEQLLAENAEYRQLLDDLRALMVALKQLPRLSLDEGFVSRVIDQTRHATQIPADDQQSKGITLELLGAYVDDELSDVDLSRVQRALEADEKSQRYVEQLRALDHDLKALPKPSLGDDFADRVLRRAERNLLAPAERDSSVSTDVEPDLTPAGRSAAGDGRPAWRGFVWSAAAIAAALLLAFLFGRDPGAGSSDIASIPPVQPEPDVVVPQTDQPPEVLPEQSPEVGEPDTQVEPPAAVTPDGAWPVVLAMQENARQRFILIYDVSVTSLGVEQGMFARFLTRHNIGFGSTFAVGDEEQGALLKRQYLKDARVAPDGEKEMDEIRLYLVSCTGNQADAMYRDLAGGPPGFASFSLNLTSGEAGGGVLNRVCDASRISERSSEAVRLMTSFAMLSETARNLGVFGTIEWVDPELLEPSPQSGADEPDKPQVADAEPQADQGDFQCELLFVVRNLQPERKMPAADPESSQPDSE